MHRALRRLTAWLLSLAMLAAFLPAAVTSAEGSTVAAAWFFSSNPGSQSAVAATEGSGELTWSGGDVSFNSTGYFNVSKWTPSAWWQMSGIDTSALGALNLRFTTSGSNTGPANWAADFSTDQGQTWTAFGAYTVTASYASVSLDLPADAACEDLRIRLHPTDAVSIAGGTVATGGTNRLGKITVSGSAEGVETLGAFTFTGVTALPAAATEGWGWLGASQDGTMAYSTSALSINQWSVDDCWLMIFNTSGCTGMELSADVLSSGTGPANFAAEYSLDNGGTWTGFGAYTIANTGALQRQTFSLPDGAQSQNLMVRFRVTDNAACKGDGAEISGSGTSKINNISLTGRIGTGRLENPAAPTWPEGWGNTEPGEDPNPGGGSGFVNADVVGDPIVQWEFSGSANLPAAASLGWGTLTHVTGAFISYGSGALVQTGWTVGAYWQFVANTTGCTDMTFQIKMASSSTGPRDFSLRYSKDLGQTWIEFATFSVTGTFKSYVTQLPDEAQSPNLVIRAVVASDASVKGDTIKNGGNNRINNIGINGVVDSSARQPDPAAPSYPDDWSLPDPYSEDDVYVPAPEEAAQTSGFTTRESDRRVLARWGGNADYQGALHVYGDLISDNDRMDGGAKLTTVVAGENVSPGFSTSSTNSTNYYMGSSKPCIGSGSSEDYIQLAVSTAKYADLDLSFRLRVSGSGPKDFAAKFSTDGENWLLFDKGSYSYAYTGYGSGGSTYEVSGEGEITGGKIPMEVAGQYEEIRLEVPAQAENAETLYIRLYASQERADGKDGGVGSSASVRMDTVLLTGCPMIAPEITDWVRVDVENTAPAGQTLTLSCDTEGAVIRYSFDLGKTVLTYSEANPPVLQSFPALLTVWAEKTGLYPSVRTHYYYTQSQVSPVKAAPNGGAVAEDTQLKLTCATDGAEIRWSADNGATWQTYDPENRPVLSRALLENGCSILVMGVKTGWLSSPVTALSFTLRQNAAYNLYFGQLHSHTNYSDGAGSCEEAFRHASTEVDNLDFLAVTDHSNAFDNDTAASIYDGSMSSKWVSGHALADQFTSESFVCLYGYEMTWSNGLGHINTYNTAGFQSRTQAEFSSFSTALTNYYSALKSDTNSLSQFNHPGTTFGTFQDYAYYDPDIDALITLIEVGNGEGAIGSSGYFPSYEEYTRALDLGWHLAPTNNQDNHKGAWGDANTARSVVMADSLTRDNIYDAIRNRRVYASEDSDLHIYYTLNSYEMGTILTEDDVDASVLLRAEISDPTDSGSCKVEVIVNGGLVAASKTVPVTGATVEFELPASYSYYYLRVTEADRDIAVTAPVWIGAVEAIGVRDFYADTELPIRGEPTEITFSMHNDEAADLEIRSIEFTVNDEIVHTVDLAANDLTVLPAGGVIRYWFDFTWEGVGAVVLNASVKGVYQGTEKQYNGVLHLNYLPDTMASNVIVDGTHFNDYVTGAWSGNTTRLAELGADHFAKVTVVTDQITPAMLDDCQLLVISAPARRTKDQYQTSHFEPEFLAAVAEYAAKGGTVVICGSADYNDTTACQTHTELNKLLAALGATVRFRSDEAVELNEKNETIYNLELGSFAADSAWLAGAEEGMTFSVYSGCSLDLSGNAANDRVEEASVLVGGNAETYTIDTKTDTGYSGTNAVLVPQGSVVMAAVQPTKAGGNLFLCGAPFFSDYNMETDEHDRKLNAVLMGNILDAVAEELPVTPIAEMRRGDLGEVFCIEGWVTNGTDNDKTKFFDTIYLQDETGGVTVYPFAELGIPRGAKLQIVGYVDEYQDDREIQVLRWKLLEGENLNLIEPTDLSCAEAMDYAANGGRLVRTQGVITEVSLQGTAVTQLRLRDAAGGVATVFIDGYIYSGTTGLNELAAFCRPGNEVSAVGLCYMHPETGQETSACCLRVRDCDEILLIQEGEWKPWELCDGGEACPGKHFTDMPAVDNWAHKPIDWAVSLGITGGTSDTTFSPKKTCTREQIVTFLYAAFEKPEHHQDSSPFSDVKTGKYYYDAVMWAVENDITGGVGDGTRFGVGQSCTREQVVTFLWKAAGAPEPEAANNPFRDVKAGKYYYNAVLWALENGITGGTSDDTFGVGKPCTRAQVVTFLYKLLGD